MSEIDIAKHVRDRMAKIGMTTEQLFEQLKGQASRASIYNWIGGKTGSIHSRTLARIMGAIGLKFTEGTPEWNASRIVTRGAGKAGRK